MKAVTFCTLKCPVRDMISVAKIFSCTFLSYSDNTHVNKYQTQNSHLFMPLQPQSPIIFTFSFVPFMLHN